MRSDPQLQRLLDDVLRERDERALKRMLIEVKLRRCLQHGAVFSLLLLFALSITTWRRPVPVHETAGHQTVRQQDVGLALTVSQPLPVSMIVESRSSGFGWISSTSDSSLIID